MSPSNRSAPRALPFLTILLVASLATCGVASAQAPVERHPGGAPEQERPRGPIRGSERFGGPVRDPNGEHTVAPVPEPGTMALASMGLIALGAAIRKRRVG